MLTHVMSILPVEEMKKRYLIERYSPLRKKWIDYNESYELKKQADERIVTLKYRHRREPDMKFRVIAIDFDPQKANKEAALLEKASLMGNLKQKIKDLKFDPKKEEIRSLSKQLKELDKA